MHSTRFLFARCPSFVLTLDWATSISLDICKGASGDYMRFYTAGAEMVRIQNNGSVSIGTATSGAKLEVNGSLLVYLNASGNSVLTVKSTDSAPVVRLDSLQTNSANIRNFAILTNNNAAGIMEFSTGKTRGDDPTQGSSANTIMTLKYDGTVGINQTSPATSLEIDRSSNATF